MGGHARSGRAGGSGAGGGLLVIPPFTQPNSPYPSTSFLAGFLRSRGRRVRQADVGLRTLLALFSRSGLERLFAGIRASRRPRPAPVARALALESAYLDAIDPAVAFLQGRDTTLAPRICHGSLLPRGPRFAAVGRDSWAFGTLGTTDRARYLATLFLEDLADLVRATVAPGFELGRYAEELARTARGFDRIARAIARPPNLVERMMREATVRALGPEPPAFVAITVPFPGTLVGALLVARFAKEECPEVPVILGGAWIGTELRDLREPRLFDHADYVTLDAGERPMLCLLEHLEGRRDRRRLCRTFVRRRGRVVFEDGAPEPDFHPAEAGTPVRDGLPSRDCLSLVEIRNPMRRLWTDGCWNKLQVAHGCYWRKCAFCDSDLDYVRRYAPVPAAVMADRIEALVAETGETGFHFVDEAAPPGALRALALALLERGRNISWWTNVRFEDAFTPDLCRLLAASGCIAVTGGLEAVGDRLLARMRKGITFAGAARVAAAFADAGVMVHLYLMYGFPTETAAETIEGLERVRQLFAAGVVQSAFWHRFTLTAHSPMAADPATWGVVVPRRRPATFAANDLPHRDPSGCDPERFTAGLDLATDLFMHGAGLDEDVRSWFRGRVPAARVPRDLVARILAVPAGRDDPSAGGRLVWLGGSPSVERTGTGRARLVLPGRSGDAVVVLPEATARWLAELLSEATPRPPAGGRVYPTITSSRPAYPASARQEFDEFIGGRAWRAVRRAGLVVA